MKLKCLKGHRISIDSIIVECCAMINIFFIIINFFYTNNININVAKRAKKEKQQKFKYVEIEIVKEFPSQPGLVFF